MKRPFLPLLLLLGIAWLPAHHAQAQEKPVLTTTPPGLPPAQPLPAPAPVLQPAAPAYEGIPAAQPTPDSPSGLNFPNRGVPQNQTDAPRPSTKFFLYTNLGAGLNSDGAITQFNASLAPAIGYRVTDKFAIGPGISYAYNSYSLAKNSGYALNVNGDQSLKSSSLGVKAFAQLIVYKEFFVHAEYEVTNAELIGYDSNKGYYKYKQRATTTPLAGIGYRSYLGERAAIDVVGLYNFGSTYLALYPPIVLRFSILYNFGK